MINNKLQKTLIDKFNLEEAWLEKFFSELVSDVQEWILEGKSLQMFGLGAFSTKILEQEILVNPFNQKKTLIPPKNVVVFTPKADSKSISEDFIKEFSLKNDYPEELSLNIFEAIAEFVQGELRDGRSVSFHNFGVFSAIDGEMDFEPDEALQDAVNAELSFLEEVELTEDLSQNIQLDTLSKEAKKIRNLLEEIQGEPIETETPKAVVEEPKAESKIAEEIAKTEPKVTEEPPKATEPKVEHLPKEEKEQSKPQPAEPIAAEPYTKDDVELPTSKGRKVWKVVATVLGLIILGCAIFLLGTRFGRYLYHKESQRTEFEASAPTPMIDTIAKDTIPTEPIEPAKPTFEERSYTEFMDTVVVQQGSTLVNFSRRYYGHKDFWLYIYEANKDVLRSANALIVGTRLRIPAMDSTLINPQDSLLMQKLRVAKDSVKR